MIQELGVRSWSAFDGNSQDTLGVGFEVRVVEGEIFKKGLNSGQTLIACFRRVVPTLDGVFQIFEEDKDGFRVQVLDAQRPVARALGAEVGDQELKGIAVTSDRIDAYAFLPTQIGLKEFRKIILEVACH
jgi:hypothetical protein